MTPETPSESVPTGPLQRMYYGLGKCGTDAKMGGGYVPNVLISAAVLWNGKKFRNLFPPRHDSLWLDSGGFQHFYRSGDFPYTATQLADLSVVLKAEFTATMDFPCEPDVKRVPGLASNEERIRRGVANARECLKIRGPHWVPVVQGFHPEEYDLCMNLLEEVKAVRPYMAIGSLCVRKKRSEAWEVIRHVQRRFPDTRLHGFGIDFRFLLDRRIKTALWSADTTAWSFHNTHGQGWRVKSQEEALRNFDRYQARVNRVLAVKEGPLEVYAA